MKYVLIFLTVLCFIIMSIVCTGAIIRSIEFKTYCKDYLKLSGDAPTVEKAKEYLDKAIEYLDKNDLRSGNSGVIIKTPDKDVGIWYQQITGARDTARKMLSGNHTQLEKDNALMKIREVVIDSGEDVEVTYPDNIVNYPNQVSFFWSVLLSTLGFCVFGIWLLFRLYV